MAIVRSRRLRLLVVAMTLLALLGLAAWQLHDRLLARLLAQAVEASGGRLTVAAIAGGPTSGFKVGRLRWQDPDGLLIDLEEARLRLRWHELLRGRVAIGSLVARTMVLRLPAGEGPPALPATLALPMPFELRSARLERLRIETAGGAPIELSALELQADYEPARASWRIHRLALRSPWGEGHLSGTLDEVAPYRIRAGTLRAVDPGLVVAAGVPAAALGAAPIVHEAQDVTVRIGAPRRAR